MGLGTPAFRRTGGNAPGWIENAPRKGWFPDLDLAEVWAGREIAAVLALRNIKIRYKQTFFGVAWALLQPLAGVAIFTLVFGRLADVPSEGIPYPVFVYSGLVVWLYFSQSATLASESLAQYRELVTKVYFPRLLTRRRRRSRLVGWDRFSPWACSWRSSASLRQERSFSCPSGLRLLSCLPSAWAFGFRR